MARKPLEVGHGGLLSPAAQAAHRAVKADLLERGEGYEYHITHNFPQLRRYDGHLMMGSFSWTDVQRKVKWVRPQHAYRLADVPWPVTPSGVARAYLRYRFGGKRHRMRGSQARAFVDNRKSAPLYAAPANIYDAVYLDIKSAYWTIVQAVGLRPEYLPGKFLARGYPAADFPYPREKLIRNILVSAGLPGWATRWDGHQLHSFRAGNPHINLMLWGVCMDVLHSIARDMVAVGALYVHTDGYIFDARDMTMADAVARAWGIPLGVKYQGKCEILGVATYHFPDKRDTRWRRSVPRYTEKIDAPPGDWLRERFATWAGRAGLEGGIIGDVG